MVVEEVEEVVAEEVLLKEILDLLNKLLVCVKYVCVKLKFKKNINVFS